MVSTFSEDHDADMFLHDVLVSWQMQIDKWDMTNTTNILCLLEEHIADEVAGLAKQDASDMAQHYIHSARTTLDVYCLSYVRLLEIQANLKGTEDDSQVKAALARHIDNDNNFNDAKIAYEKLKDVFHNGYLVNTGFASWVQENWEVLITETQAEWLANKLYDH